MNYQQKLEQYANELHAPFRKGFPNRRVESHYPRDIFGADLVDMSAFADQNEGYKFLLTVIDVFSRKAWAVPLKDKRGITVLNAFRSIGEVPHSLWIDQGGEFYNRDMKRFNQKHKITMYSSFGEHKSAYVERFNKTLRELMWRDRTVGKSNWVRRLPGLLQFYNNRVHSSTKMQPRESYATGKTKEDRKVRIIDTAPKFKVGDWVRIARKKNVFEKGYTYRWSHELFKIVGVNNEEYPTMYQLEEYPLPGKEAGDKIQGKFYEQELQKTAVPDFFLIEKVLRTRSTKDRRGRRQKELLVRWMGWDAKYDSWEPESEVKRLQNLVT